MPVSNSHSNCASAPLLIEDMRGSSVHVPAYSESYWFCRKRSCFCLLLRKWRQYSRLEISKKLFQPLHSWNCLCWRWNLYLFWFNSIACWNRLAFLCRWLCFIQDVLHLMICTFVLHRGLWSLILNSEWLIANSSHRKGVFLAIQTLELFRRRWDLGNCWLVTTSTNSLS